MARPVKLSFDDGREILGARANGESWKSIAQRYEVERSTVYRAVQRVLQRNRRVLQRLGGGQATPPRT
jgi:Mor family transcriptional regulator